MERQHSALIDIMGLSLCHMALSSIKLDSLITGVVLLSGLFFYDIWWVFGSKPVFGSNVVSGSLLAPLESS
jgi:minor histocompatibility antigen H13